MTHVDGLRALSILYVVIFHLLFIVYRTLGDRLPALQSELHDPWYCQQLPRDISIWTLAAGLPVVWGISIAISAVCYVTIERPLMNLRDG